jgi:hypothetical protein
MAGNSTAGKSCWDTSKRITKYLNDCFVIFKPEPALIVGSNFILQDRKHIPDFHSLIARLPYTTGWNLSIPLSYRKAPGSLIQRFL